MTPTAGAATGAIRRLPTAAALVPLLAACAAERPAQSPPRPARVSHVVLISLKDPADRDKLIRHSDRMAARIPDIASYAAGTPLDIGRPNVLSDYDVGLYVGFDSARAYELYIDHPAHVELVETWRDRIERLDVRDFLDRAP